MTRTRPVCEPWCCVDSAIFGCYSVADCGPNGGTGSDTTRRFPNKRSASGAGSVPSPAADATAVDRPVSWKLLLPNLISDQERIWSFPARLVQGQNWIPTAAVLGTTAGLVALDPTEAHLFPPHLVISGVQQHFYRQRHGRRHDRSSGLALRSSGSSGKTRKCNERRCSRAKPSPTLRS